MRVPVLATLSMIGLTGGAVAQTSVYVDQAPQTITVPYGGGAAPSLPPPPGGYPMPPPGEYAPPPGSVPAPRAAMTPSPAPSAPAPLAPTPIAPTGVPPGANPATGARPGNEIGTGMSLPMSTQSSNIGAPDTRSPIAPRLPTPTAGDDATIRAYLANARDALASGRTGEAQEALERAETRMLDRSVAPEDVRNPIHGPGVADVSAARTALASGNIPGAIQVIDAALAR